ncbi:MAG TPA: cell division protein FtsL [Burkholderiales bacterium]|nr:cell division protein FtsL [Burkholderiales bacterium]
MLAVLTMCALALVTSQHEARRTLAELEREQARAHQIEVEWGQLQLEQSTWAMHTRIEKLAREKIRMQQPEQNRVEVLQGGGGA